MHEQICLGAPGRAQHVLRGAEKRTPDPPAGVRGMDEEQKQLAVFGMGGGVADDPVRVVDGDE